LRTGLLSWLDHSIAAGNPESESLERRQLAHRVSKAARYADVFASLAIHVDEIIHDATQQEVRFVNEQRRRLRNTDATQERL
jgi:hypothetical protein